MYEVIFDVETKKLFSEITTDRPGDLGVSIVSAYFRTVDDTGRELSGVMKSFWEADFPELFEHFQKADRIIGFNTKFFDVPALQPYASFDLSPLNHFDILELVKNSLGRRISLNALASVTLKNTKIDHGTNAVIYWKQGDPESLQKLQMYCEADVALTRDLYDFGMLNKCLHYMDNWNAVAKIPIDFSYPPPPSTEQMGLF